MKVLGFVSVLILMTACNSTVPTATTYKQQLGAPAAGTQSPVGSGNATPGDAAKGQAALTASCVSCHKVGGGGIGHDLVAADAASLTSGAAAKNAAHGGVAAVFTSSSGDIAAYLSGGSAKPAGDAAAALGDAAKGDTLLKAQCESCHAIGGAGVGPELDQFSNVDGQLSTSATKTAAHGPAITTAIDSNTADIKAALKNR